MIKKGDKKLDDKYNSIIMEDNYRNDKIAEQVINLEKQREKMAALGQLAGGIAHDFNNQLMSIIGNATMIQKTEDINKIKEYAERIIRISQSTANLTKKILLFSKKECSINEIINLQNILDNTYTIVGSILDKKINVNYNYNAKNKMIMGNETQIENLIINLMINSRDAMELGGIINIGSEDVIIHSDKTLSHGDILSKGEYIKIYVEDNGCGMDEEALNKMFEPYFTTKSKSKGTGLGLSVVFGTINSHSGAINVISEKEKGTTMEIYLPLRGCEKEMNVENATIRDNEGDLVLLVDDDKNVLDIEAELLEDLGYDVEKHSNPLKALKYYQSEHKNINFVVLDMMMPEMTGKELYEEFKKINKDVSVIFISGYSYQKDYEELVKEGAIFIEKPFTFEELSFEIAKMYK